MAIASLSLETLREMLSIIREARNDMKKLSDTASMVSSALSKPQGLNLKKKAENPLGLEGDESVLLKQVPAVCKVVDGRNHQMLASNASSGREMSRNLENSLGNFVEHMVGQKQHEVSMVENPKMERYSGGCGLLKQAPLPTSTVTSPLPKKPPDPPDIIHGKSRNKGTIFPKYSCEEMYERMEMGLCVFCEEFDTPGHYQLKHKGLQICVIECDDEEKVEDLVDSVSIVFDQKKKQATDHEYKHAEAKLADYYSLQNGYQDDSAILIKSSHDLKLSVAHEFSDSHRSVLSLSEPVLRISGADVNEEKHCICLSQAERIWEPGGLPTEAAQWYWREKPQSLWIFAAMSETRADRIWEPGGYLVKTDREMLQTEAVLHGQVQFHGLEMLENDRLQSCIGLNLSEFGIDHGADILVNQMNHIKETSVPRVWEPGGSEIYGLKRKKQMVTLINQGPKVEEMLVVKVLQVSHVYSCCKEFEWLLRYGCKETEVSPEKSSNDANVSKRLGESRSLRQPALSDIKYHRKYRLRAVIMWGATHFQELKAAGLERMIQAIMESFVELSKHMMQECLLSASVWNLLTKHSQNCSFFEFILQWKWYPPEQSCQTCSGWFLKLWTWKKRVRFYSSRWLIFGDMVASPSYTTGQRCIKVSQPHMDVVISLSKEMRLVTSTWSLHKLLTATETFHSNMRIIHIILLSQWNSFGILLIVIARSLTFWSAGHIFVAEKNKTKISISGCYDSYSEQSRDCGFSVLLTQWEEHPPDEATSELFYQVSTVR